MVICSQYFLLACCGLSSGWPPFIDLKFTLLFSVPGLMTGSSIWLYLLVNKPRGGAVLTGVGADFPRYIYTITLPIAVPLIIVGGYYMIRLTFKLESWRKEL